jgi:hypothetical protein
MNKKLSYKKFIMLFFSFIVIYIFYHFTIWNLYTSEIFGRNDGKYIGDLGRMSYQVDSLYPRKLEYTLPKKILNHKNNFHYNAEPFDILTIGDSFSNGVMGGKNPYYQDFLATRYNKDILNMMNITNNEHQLFRTIISLYNNGWLKEHKPNFILIESAQRGVYQRFARDFNFSIDNIKANGHIPPAKIKDSFIPPLLFINSANYKLPFYTIKYHFKERAQRDVVKTYLTKALFSPKNFQSELLFHYSDLTSIQNNQKLVEKINENFNTLARMLKKLNIKLIFMPVVDKYDLYSPYIKNNHYQKNRFFEMLRPLKKEYIFIDTKKILSPLLKQGVKDLYYSDDTHWSYKASEAIAKDKTFQEILR